MNYNTGDDPEPLPYKPPECDSYLMDTFHDQYNCTRQFVVVRLLHCNKCEAYATSNNCPKTLMPKLSTRIKGPFPTYCSAMKFCEYNNTTIVNQQLLQQLSDDDVCSEHNRKHLILKYLTRRIFSIATPPHQLADKVLF